MNKQNVKVGGDTELSHETPPIAEDIIMKGDYNDEE